jgi:hypothetical protein
VFTKNFDILILTSFSGARSNADIPGLIQAGFRAVVVYMDVWGIAMAVAGNLAEGRKYALEIAEQHKAANGKANGQATEVTINGK